MRRSSNSNFQRGSGVYTCQECGKRTRATGRGDCEHVQLCGECYDLAGWENLHSDRDHENHPDPDCPICLKREINR
jgi:hypothetical protein